MRCLGTAVGRAAPRQLAAPQLAAKRGASPQQLLPLRWGVRTRTAAGAANSQDDGSGGAVATTSAPELQADLPLPADLKEHFRPNVGVCVVNRQGLVFAATRVDDAAKTWQMPQGGIDRGESAAHAAMRELYEETSIRSVRLVGTIDRWLPYEFPTSVRCKLSGSWARYRGQAQRWFLLQFTGEDAEVNLQTEHCEFSDWRWMPLEELPASVIDFKRGVYQQVADEFAPRIKGLVQEHGDQ